ncbi:sensor histidine kinase [Loktanella salsilacus]|uniref:sensor histidine kinase n=1 Tax=Loktanella salsilacus TaxID=195913 RepID=UPI0037358ADA
MATEEHYGRVNYRSLLLRAVILTSFLCAVTFGIGVIYKLGTEVENIQTAEQSDPLWIGSQLQFELLRLERDLGEVALGYKPVSEISNRFDIAWSRINVLQVGKLQRLLSEFNVDRSVLSDLEATFVLLDPAIIDLVASDSDHTQRVQNVGKILAELEGFDGRLRSFLISLAQSKNAAMADFRSGLLSLSAAIAYLGATILTLFFIFVILLWLEIKSSRRTSEAMTLLAQEAVSASEMKMNFMSVVSHELRTPMTSILGGLTLLKVRINKTTQDPTTLKLLEVACRNGDRLLLLVNDILDAQALSEGKVAIERKVVDLKEVVTTAVENCNPYANKLGVTYEVVATGEKLVTYTDGARVSQVLVNLLSNAAKFTTSGDVVSVKVSKSEDKARVEIRDKGIGISTDEQKHIFTPFHQANPGSTAGNKSSGLGLSITKQLMDLLGGEIGVQSVEGEGAMFWIELDLHPQS